MACFRIKFTFTFTFHMTSLYLTPLTLCHLTARWTVFRCKADSTRALKTRQLRRLTKRVATPTEFSNEEIYKNSRSNLDERFGRLQFGVSSASSDSSAVRGVVNASARNVVQSTLSRLLKRAVQTHV